MREDLCPDFFVYTLLGRVGHVLSLGLKPPLLCVERKHFITRKPKTHLGLGPL